MACEYPEGCSCGAMEWNDRESRVEELESENTKLRKLLKRGLDEFEWEDGPEGWGDFIDECHEILKPNTPA